MQMYITDRLHIGYSSLDPEIPPGYRSKHSQSRSCFRDLHVESGPSKKPCITCQRTPGPAHVDTYNDAEMDAGITDQECSYMEMEYISLLRIK